LSTHLRLGLPSGLFPSGFPTNIDLNNKFNIFTSSPYFIFFWRSDPQKYYASSLLGLKVTNGHTFRDSNYSYTASRYSKYHPRLQFP
jgi:hypothetical protein